ncbi:unnamed protein product, partial [Larinioides sclopetarius]
MARGPTQRRMPGTRVSSRVKKWGCFLLSRIKYSNRQKIRTRDFDESPRFRP